MAVKLCLSVLWVAGPGSGLEVGVGAQTSSQEPENLPFSVPYSSLSDSSLERGD